MSPRSNAASMDELDDQTQPDTRIAAVPRPRPRPSSGPQRWRGVPPAPIPARTERTSGIQVSPGKVTPPPAPRPRPMPRAAHPPPPLTANRTSTRIVAAPRPLVAPSRSSAAPASLPSTPTSLRASLVPAEASRSSAAPASLPSAPTSLRTSLVPASTAPASAPSTATSVRASLAPTHSEQRWSQAPAPASLPEPTLWPRSEPTLELAARESRHSYAPPAVADSAARFLPWYWRAWLLVAERLGLEPTAQA